MFAQSDLFVFLPKDRTVCTRFEGAMHTNRLNGSHSETAVRG